MLVVILITIAVSIIAGLIKFVRSTTLHDGFFGF